MTITDVLKELNRERAMRVKVYGNYVRSGKMTPRERDHRIEVIDYLIADYEKRMGKGAQANLDFGSVPFKPSRPLVFLDIETTSANVDSAKMIDLSMVKYRVGGKIETSFVRVNPGKPILKEATAVHGISPKDVADLDLFNNTVANQIRRFTLGCDLAGYNILKFDLPILAREFEDLALPEWPHKGTKVIDVYKMIQKAYPQTLSGIYERMFGNPLHAAHNAEADCRATLDIFMQFLSDNAQFGSNTNEICKQLYNGYEIVDPFMKVAYNEKKQLVWLFGEYKGKPVDHNKGFALWVLGKNFPSKTKELISDYINK